MSLYPLYRPLVFALPPETAHRMAIRALQLASYLPAARLPAYPRLTQKCFGLVFENPLGLAAGFDKSAEAYHGLLKRGFGFVEVGSITPKPQHGNPKPRLFRLEEPGAIINRMGFNNDGMERAHARLARRDRTVPGIVGVNIGRNKTSANTPDDYLLALDSFYMVSDYITVNISSPNTPSLRQMQQGDSLIQLLEALADRREYLQQRHGYTVPVLLKIAPDMEAPDAAELAQLALETGMAGLIISNTTISREGVESHPHANEQGGLSGIPLLNRSNQLLKTVYQETQGRLPLIGAGGIATAEDAYARLRAGATLIQLYTSLIYKGFCIIPEILEGLDTLVSARRIFPYFSDHRRRYASERAN